MDSASRIIEVDINDILPNRNQPRLILNEEDDLGLTDSVKEYGVLQPIIVRNIGDKYEIIAGERRYRASVLAGRETVPVIVRNMTDKESAEIALIENVQRKELTPIEEALSYKNILDLGYMTQEQLAEKIGKSQPTIANKIRLLNLSDEVQDALLENKISERHARSLLKIKNKKQQNDMLERIINERLTVRKTDEEIGKLTPLDSDDDSEENSLVIERKEGENNMNNEINNIPQFTNFTNIQPTVEPVQQTVPQFDIFASSSNESVSAPAQTISPSTDIQPVVEPAQTTIPQFDIFANTPAQPEVNIFANSAVEPVTQQNTGIETVQPFVAPTSPVEPAQTTIPQFDIFASAPAAPADNNIFSNSAVEPVTQQDTGIETVQPFVNPQPALEPAPAVPEFDIFANATPAQPVTEQQPVAAPAEENISEYLKPEDVISISEEDYNKYAQPDANDTPSDDESANVPVTAPIQEQPQQLEEVKPEPIIITDYNKQYDPIMPQTEEVPVKQADFKAVIDAIRECASKIESYGYKIDVDEFDLTNIYQAIFKIEKM